MTVFKIFGIEIRVDQHTHYSARIGNTTKGFYAITPEIRKQTIEACQELIKELLTN